MDTIYHMMVKPLQRRVECNVRDSSQQCSSRATRQAHRIYIIHILHNMDSNDKEVGSGTFGRTNDHTICTRARAEAILVKLECSCDFVLDFVRCCACFWILLCVSGGVVLFFIRLGF